MPEMQQPASLRSLAGLVGEWTLEGRHRLYPNIVIRGRTSFEWLKGGAFLVQRWSVEPSEFPSGIAVIGRDEASEGLGMHYFDSRGVSRIYQLSLNEGVWRMWRASPGSSQRFTGRFQDQGNTIKALWELSTDDSHWERDLELTYRKIAPGPGR